MKPTRGRFSLWPIGLPREQQLALGATALLLILLSGMVFYQQLGPGSRPAPIDSGVEGPGVGLSESEAPSTDGTTTPAQGDAPLTSNPGSNTGAGLGGPGQPVSAAPPESLRPDRLSAPLSDSPRILKPFGSIDQSYGDYRLFDAIAFEALPGQAVLAAASGRVVAIDEDPIHGRSLLLDHGGGMVTRYAGLGAVFVGEAAQVEAGSTIGEVGEPGPIRSALGPHLSFAVTLDEEPVDPAPFLND